MATSADDMKFNFPLPAYNYQVEIDGEAFAFTEVSGLNIAYETTTFKESPVGRIAGPVIYNMPAQATATTVTLKKGIILNAHRNLMTNWINSVQANLVEKRDILIKLCNEAGEPVVSWHVINAFPTRLDAPTFDANTNDVAIETMELMADRVVVQFA
ncbi:MAG: phage tail protein [Anaerolineales bacterium]|nr:phage tail protein [Anaerolineales bacterium]MCB0011968.1 phage tail protein [Anaerolineales bacterium]MCB0017660.1 phage tail protein [Anaerolineales bacterium]MCB0031539.1 phage tail protein [Anaerolineales bacterium]MCB8963001.1 phage tail protein [Ardenticatenales bacterium]